VCGVQKVAIGVENRQRLWNYLIFEVIQRWNLKMSKLSDIHIENIVVFSIFSIFSIISWYFRTVRVSIKQTFSVEVEVAQVAVERRDGWFPGVWLSDDDSVHVQSEVVARQFSCNQLLPSFVIVVYGQLQSWNGKQIIRWKVRTLGHMSFAKDTGYSV